MSDDKSLIAARAAAAQYVRGQCHGANADDVVPTPPTSDTGRRLVGELC